MKRKRGFFWHLYPYIILIVLLSVSAVVWFTYHLTKEFYINEVTTDLRARASMVITAFIEGNYPLDTKAVDPFCDKLGKASSTRITFIMPSGKVIGDSEKDPESMDNHADRPEFKSAMEKGFGTSRRYSFTLKRYMMYVALPMKKDGKTVAIVRTSIPLKSIGKALSRPRSEMILGALLILLLSMFFGYIISKRLTYPISKIRDGAEKIAKGNIQLKIPEIGPEEIKTLAESLNIMAQSLKRRIEKITEQKNQMDTILSGMFEGVIALDDEDSIISINPSAQDILGLRGKSPTGKTIQEIIRIKEFHELVLRARNSSNIVEKEIRIDSPSGEKVIMARGSIVRDDTGKSKGILLVLHDITKMKRLENVRKDFVSNVSHELKTPITAIKGALETLEENIDRIDENSARFLEIIKRNTERLYAIVEDLLTLSRLEQDDIQRQIIFKETNIFDVASSSIETLLETANKRNIKISLTCDKELKAKINPRLMEQAIINLIDNAIKYSDEGKTIEVKARWVNANIEISVSDEGCGIDKTHLPRIFERFYRVDKARSRSMGGTGLGLSIVKHVAQIHGGSVNVVSEPGKGSTFSITIPRNIIS